MGKCLSNVSRSSHSGLCWIIALLCFTISSYLYFCKSWSLSLPVANDLVCPALFQVTMVDRRWCGSGTTWWCLVQLSRLLDPLTSHIICIRLSVNVTCKLWLVAPFSTRNICCMSVCPGGGIPPLWLFIRFLLLFFFYPVKRVSFSPSTWSFSSLKWRSLGQRMLFTVQIVKPTEGMWLWLWAIWVKLIWNVIFSAPVMSCYILTC